MAGPRPSLNRLAFSATAHCLAGCSIGEVLGMVIGTALGWSNGPTVALAVALAFVFGYLMTLVPLVRGAWPSPPPSPWPSHRTRCPSRSWRSSTTS